MFQIMFSFWPKVGDKGDKILRENNWQGASRDSFFSLEILSPSEPTLRAKIENMISPDYVLYPEPIRPPSVSFPFVPQKKNITVKMARLWESLKILDFFLENFAT